MPKIVISYRRSDSQDITGRIFDRLAQRFGRDTVFRDIDNIRPGSDFRSQIVEALKSADVLLVVMGPKWIGRSRGSANRIDNEADPVRVEVETALERHIPLIPVLVGGAKLPPASQIPSDIRDIVYRHAVTVDGGRDFDHHLEGLCRSLDKMFAPKRPDVGNSDISPPFALQKPESQTTGNRVLLVLSVVIVLTMLVGIIVGFLSFMRL